MSHEESRRAAGDVASAVIGPLKRLRAGGWDFRDNARRSLEAAAASWVVDALEVEGLLVKNVWSPDYQRSRLPERIRRPELAFELNGEPAALDVTLFASEPSSRARARAVDVRRTIQDRLRDLPDTGSRIFGLVVYDEPGLLRLSKTQQRLDADGIADAYVAAVLTPTPSSGATPVAGSLPGWVRGASITITADSGARRDASIYLLPPRLHVDGAVDEFISARARSKGAQMAEWGRSILAVVHGFDVRAQDLAAGFERYGSSPWWRVYWVDSAPPVQLVATREVPGEHADRG